MSRMELINASAGSGKTYSLTERVVEEIKSGTDPESIMATTFTNKAAAELCKRIRVSLLKEGYYEEANRISGSFIGTVNSICARLLKEYAIESGMSPAIETMPEEDSARIFNISIDRVIEKNADGIEPAARRMDLDGRGSGYNKNRDWREYAKRVVDIARSNRIEAERLEGFANESWESLSGIFGEAAEQGMEKELAKLIKVAISSLENTEGLKKKTQKALDELKKHSRSIEKARLTWGDWVRISKLDAAKDGQDDIAPVALFADRVLRNPSFQSDIKSMIDGVFGCASEALIEYARYKKEHGLMDFADQETYILDMAIGNRSFRESLGERIDVLMVDEFQDTSPIQLALFLELNGLAGKSVWVGDPKQAIYGFRGTDPQLMEEVVRNEGESKVLGYSWRSEEKLVDFTNALFSKAFHQMDSSRVCLKLPPQRMKKAKGGRLEEWHLEAKNKQGDADALARGTKDLLERIPKVRPGDIAVLCRTNKECEDIAGSLKRLGIRASVGEGSLMDTKECALAMAALRYMSNEDDGIALTEIVKTMSEYARSRDWLKELVLDPDGAKEKWKREEVLALLNAGRKEIRHWTPLEALEQAICRIGLLRMARLWENPNLAKSNLDALRGACVEYMGMCSSHRSAATIGGFVSYMAEEDKDQSKGIGLDTVNVLTYHGSKGLEWPWVILAGLDKSAKSNVFGVEVEEAKEFDPANPLANRKIRFWPWPFGSQKGYESLDSKLGKLPLAKEAADKVLREEKRLMYVGMTRAGCGLVLAMRKTAKGLKTANLDAITDSGGNKIIDWDADSGEKEIMVGGKKMGICAFDYAPEEDEAAIRAEIETRFLPKLSRVPTQHPPSRISPSTIESGDGPRCTWKEICRFGSRMTIKGKPEMDKLGNAVHSYMAVDHKALSREEKLSLSESIIEKWGMGEHIGRVELVDAADRLGGFVLSRYPGGKAFREWPMSMRMDNGQIVHGWIDLLIETEDEYTIVDHKDYPGPDLMEKAKKYQAQLLIYKEAVEKATGKPVKDMLLHFPVSGRILKLELEGHKSYI